MATTRGNYWGGHYKRLLAIIQYRCVGLATGSGSQAIAYLSGMFVFKQLPLGGQLQGGGVAF
jgi:hypothetical protein